MRRRPAMLALAAVAASGLLAGCGGSNKSGGGFDVGATGATCLVHQKHSPSTPYEGGSKGNTELEFDFLRYYTAHGKQSFCDGKPASAIDRKWGLLYATLTSDPSDVSSLIGTA